LRTSCTAFDWEAPQLPFLPALRYGRTILSPPQVLAAADLPGPMASWPDWSAAAGLA
jgi:hypothetical protein